MKVSARDAFFHRIKSVCGARFEGQSTFPADPGDSFSGKKLVATISSCDAQQIHIPFVVGKDRSRTWILTRTPESLQLKHDHRHADGNPDQLTNYGGSTQSPGTELSQSFPADAYTAELIPEAASNEWFISLSADGTELIYYLERHSKPRFKAVLFRVE
jgi:hypothetical protein